MLRSSHGRASTHITSEDDTPVFPSSSVEAGGEAGRSRMSATSVEWLLDMHPLSRGSQRSPVASILLRLAMLSGCRQGCLYRVMYFFKSGYLVVCLLSSSVPPRTPQPESLCPWPAPHKRCDHHQMWSQQGSTTTTKCFVAQWF